MKSRIVKGTPADSDTTRSSKPASPSSSSKVIKKDVASAKDDARQIRTAAEGEASEVLEQAKAEAAQIREEAREQGYEEGLAKLNDLIVEFEEKRDQLYRKHRDEVLRLAMMVARKVLGHELKSSPDTLGDLVVQAIRGAQREGRVRIRIHPNDMETLRAQHDRLLSEIGSSTEFEFIEDRAIDGGGCIVESSLGIIDARLDTQLKVIERALLSKR